MYLIPEPKKMTLQGGHLCCYGLPLVLDARASDRSCLAARELRKTLEANGCYGIKLVKPLTVPEKCIYLTFARGDETAQGYTLTVSETGIVVKGDSERGLFYGIQTLIQIAEQTKVNIPCMEIVDAPDNYERGYFLDATRGRTPTLEGMKRFIDRLVRYKYTDLHLYLEHAFQWQGFEEIYTEQGFFTAEEILELDRYCHERYIELVPAVATMSHLYNLCVSKSFHKYSELADYKPEAHFWTESGIHHCLDISNPESYLLMERMLDQVVPLFHSKKFNINCDDAVDMGNDRSKPLADKIGKGPMYAAYLNKLYDYLHGQHGKEVMFWGDVVGNYFPQCTGDCSMAGALLPEDITCLYWNYVYPYRADRLQTIIDAGMKQLVFCAWDSHGIVPLYHGHAGRKDVAYENIAEMAQLAVDHKSYRFLLSTWGHSRHAEMNFPQLAYGGAKSWNCAGNANMEAFDAHISAIEYGDARVLTLLNEISILALSTTPSLLAQYNGVRQMKALGEAPEFALMEPEAGLRGQYDAIREREQALLACNFNESRDAVLTCVKLTRLEIAVKLSRKDPVMDNFALAIEIERWLEEYAAAWRKYNKEGGLHRTFDFYMYYCSVLRTGRWD